MKVPATIQVQRVRDDPDPRFAATCDGVTGCGATPWGALIELAHLLGAADARAPKMPEKAAPAK